jgi:hypothetical protein
MKIYVPTNIDYLQIDEFIIKFEKLKKMNIDFDRGIIDYELWVDTKEVTKIPGPRGHSSTMFLGNHEIQRNAKVCLLSMQNQLKNHVVDCFVKDTSYISLKHKYVISFSVNYKKDKMADNFNDQAFCPANRAMYLDLD